MANKLLQFLTKGKDPSHANFNENMARQLEAFLAAAPQGGISIYSGTRSIPRQAELFRDAVKKYGSEKAARRHVAPPGKSRHNFGTAADLQYANQAARDWAHQNAANYGLNFRLGHEPWHIELANQGTTLNSVPAAVTAPLAPLSEGYTPPANVAAPPTYSPMVETAAPIPPPAPTPEEKPEDKVSAGIEEMIKGLGGGQQTTQQEQPIQSILPSLEAGDAARIQAAQTLMSSLMTNRRKNMRGLSLTGVPNALAS